MNNLHIFLDEKIGGRAFLDLTKDEWKKDLEISFGGVRTLCLLQKEVKGISISPRKNIK